MEANQLHRRHAQHPIAWFNDLNNRGVLELDPPFQRRSVWNQSFKDYFIDSVLLRYPAPALFLYEEIAEDGTTRYDVVDGKQRLTAIFEFVGGVFPVSEASPAEALRGLYFTELPAERKATFWTYELAVEFLPTTDELTLTDVFDRLNKNVSRLTRQELRHARYSGPFITAAEDLTDWMHGTLGGDVPRFTPTSRKQMKDVEVVTQLLLLIENGPQTLSQDDLDVATSDRDTEWPREQEVVAEFRRVVDAVASMLAVSRAPAEWNHRLRNQADFYSFVGAVLGLSRRQLLPADPTGVMAALDDFMESVNTEAHREADETVNRYYQAIRSNSNGATERRARIAVVEGILAPPVAA